MFCFPWHHFCCCRYLDREYFCLACICMSCLQHGGDHVMHAYHVKKSHVRRYHVQKSPFAPDCCRSCKSKKTAFVRASVLPFLVSFACMCVCVCVCVCVRERERERERERGRERERERERESACRHMCMCMHHVIAHLCSAMTLFCGSRSSGDVGLLSARPPKPRCHPFRCHQASPILYHIPLRPSLSPPVCVCRSFLPLSLSVSPPSSLSLFVSSLSRTLCLPPFFSKILSCMVLGAHAIV
jgi:hypothetical protein